MPKLVDTTLSEGLVLGLLKQGVRKYLAIFGHGSTDLGEVLRIYEEEGVTRTFNCRNEVGHGARRHGAALAVRRNSRCRDLDRAGRDAGLGRRRWLPPRTVSASTISTATRRPLAKATNMQQVPKEEQGLFGQMTAIMGGSYVLHTPEALRDALRRGALTVNHPYRAGPFFLLLPLNTQPAAADAQPCRVARAAATFRRWLPRRPRRSSRQRQLIAAARTVAIKAGGGTRGHDAAVRRLAEAAGAAVVLSPGSTGVLPDVHAQNMHVGGSKGSISGNYAMAEANC